MDRRVLLVAAVLLVLAAVTVPGVATLPEKSPLPPASPFGTVWNLVVDLQNQINALTVNLQKEISNVKAQIAAIPGPTHFGERQELEFEESCGSATYTATAETDGIVTCSAQSEGVTKIIGSIREYNGPYWSGRILAYDGDLRGDGTTNLASISMPVKKGEVYDISVIYVEGSEARYDGYWTPLMT